MPNLYRASKGRSRIVSAENWHEERDRLVQLLKAVESGKITHIDEEDLRQLQAANPENIALIKERLAQLNARLGDRKGKG
jgi:predicted nucleotidyltransferase